MHRLDEERTLLLYLVAREMLCYEATDLRPAL